MIVSFSCRSVQYPNPIIETLEEMDKFMKDNGYQMLEVTYDENLYRKKNQAILIRGFGEIYFLRCEMSIEEANHILKGIQNILIKHGVESFKYKIHPICRGALTINYEEETFAGMSTTHRL